MGRQPVSDEILGLKVTSHPLPFERAQPLIPDIGEFLLRIVTELGAAAAAGIKGTDQAIKLVEKLNPPSVKALLETINKHAKTILSTTNVELHGEIRDLGKDKDRTAVFDEHPDAFVPIVIFAGRVTFQRFFPDIGRLVSGTQTPSS